MTTVAPGVPTGILAIQRLANSAKTKTTAQQLQELIGTSPNEENAGTSLGAAVGAATAPASTNKSLASLLTGTANSAAAPLTALKNSTAAPYTSSATAAEGPINPTAILAQTGSGTAGGYTPLQFAAALKLAKQRLGGGPGGAFNSALAADEANAGRSKTQALGFGHQAETDDATLYGHLGNYIAGLQHAGGIEDKDTTKEIARDYNNQQNAIDNIYHGNNRTTNAALGSRGLARNADSGANQSDQRQESVQGNADKVTALAQQHMQGDAFDRLMNQTHADVVTTGTGKVADEKSALNAQLSQIASALATQAGSVGLAKSSAQQSYRSQLGTLAQQLMANSSAQDPQTPDNILKEQKIAEGYQKLGLPATGSATSGSASVGVAPIVAAPKSKTDEALQQLGVNAPKGHAATLESIFNYMLNHKNQDPDPYNPNNYSTDLANLFQSIANRKGQGYGTPDDLALRQAYTYLTGK